METTAGDAHVNSNNMEIVGNAHVTDEGRRVLLQLRKECPALFDDGEQTSKVANPPKWKTYKDLMRQGVPEEMCAWFASVGAVEDDRDPQDF